MSYKLIILDRAQEEIDEAYDYYSKISSGVLRSFDEHLEKVYQSLEANPFYEIRYEKLRALPFKSFPFVVFFKVDERSKTVYIYSVFHTSQNPEKYP